MGEGNVKCSQDEKLEDPKDASVIWIGHANEKNGTATDEIIKEQVLVPGQQMCITNFAHKNLYVFCSKYEIIVKMNTV
jgi:hypothetical protein